MYQVLLLVVEGTTRAQLVDSLGHLQIQVPGRSGRITAPYTERELTQGPNLQGTVAMEILYFKYIFS
jgi:hypothetical protein